MKASSSFLMVVGVINTNGTMNRDDISDYVAANMKDPISRTSGVGDVQLFGSQYAMRIWMDPNKLNNFQLTPVDVISALKAQNARGRGPVRRYAAGVSRQPARLDHRADASDQYGRVWQHPAEGEPDGSGSSA